MKKRKKKKKKGCQFVTEKKRKGVTCAPDGGLVEAFKSLALSEYVEVTAGTELGEQEKPVRRVDTRVERGQKWVVQQFKYFPLCPRPSFFAPTNQLLLVHHFRRENTPLGPTAALEFGQVHGADVAGAQPLREFEVRECQLSGRGLGSDLVDCGPARVGGRGSGFGQYGAEPSRRGGRGRERGFGAGACASFVFGGCGCSGGGEANALEIVG